MSLETEVAAGRLEISADTISMSVSELTSLYREGVLEIRPEFQRLYRWTPEQKSRLVESILLGIPLPSLFVSQSDDGKWELVDGLQRVSTLLELQGLLVAGDGQLRPPLRLEATKYLPSLEGHTWEGEPGPNLTEAQRLDVRLARIDVKVIKRGSAAAAKYDLFQRLNSFGSTLMPQEVRSALIAGTNGECLAWLARLANFEPYRSALSLSDRLIEEQYDIELLLRFLMLHDRSETAPRLTDFSTRLDEWSIDLAGRESDWGALGAVFEQTFTWLDEHGGDLVFRKWDARTDQFRGGFLNTSYEVIALGTGYLIAHGSEPRGDVLEAAKTLWRSNGMNTRFATGLATQDRLLKTLPLGRRLMADPRLEPSDVDQILM